MRPGELQRLAKREGKSEPMDQPERESDDPPAMHVARSCDVLDCHIDDGRCDQSLYQRREPEIIRRESERRSNQRDRMRDRECCHHHNQRTNLPEWDHEAEKKEQMIGAVKDVEETFLDEPQSSLMPARIQVDHSRIAREL